MQPRTRLKRLRRQTPVKYPGQVHDGGHGRTGAEDGGNDKAAPKIAGLGRLATFSYEVFFDVVLARGFLARERFSTFIGNARRQKT